jgi:hypothetical protein
MPRRITVIELQDIVQRLRMGQPVKAIHRETGRHKNIICTLRALAMRERWLESDRDLPYEGEPKRLYEEARHISQEHHRESVSETWFTEDRSGKALLKGDPDRFLSMSSGYVEPSNAWFKDS